MKKNKTAVTLVEVVVTSILASIICAALIGGFGAMLTLMRRVPESHKSISVNIALERVGADIKEMTLLPSKRYESAFRVNGLAGFTYIKEYDFKDNEFYTRPVYITYRLKSNVLFREILVGADALNRKSKKRSEPMLVGVDKLIFKYATYDRKTKAIKWTSSYKQGMDSFKLPIAVDVELGIKDRNDNLTTFHKIVYLQEAAKYYANQEI